MNYIARAIAPGKIILTGEHFVVLGAPAVAMAVNLYATVIARRGRSGDIEVGASVPLKQLDHNEPINTTIPTQLLEPLILAARETLDYTRRNRDGISIDVDCKIPVGAGLGSSASTTVAIIRAVSAAVGARLSREDVFKIAFGPESFLHGKPSGVDHATSIFGGTIRFTRPSAIERLNVKAMPHILVCDTGIHRPTRKLVGAVVRRSRQHQELFEKHVTEVRRISTSAIHALEKGDHEELGQLMNRNHELLVEIGVSHPRLNQFVENARKRGALGAKLTGAGGGGCMIALFRTQADENRVARVLRRIGGRPYRILPDPKGARTTVLRGER